MSTADADGWPDASPAATRRGSSRLKVHTLCSCQSAQETTVSTASRRDTTGDEAVIVESKALIREYLQRRRRLSYPSQA
jgi:hypothetical protein